MPQYQQEPHFYRNLKYPNHNNPETPSHTTDKAYSD